MDCSSETQKPHAICVPAPLQGHITPMLKLAKLLHHEGFYITFAYTETDYRRLLNSHGLDSLNSSSTFQIKAIPDGLPHDSHTKSPFEYAIEFVLFLKYKGLVPLRNLISNINKSTTTPVTCIVADTIVVFANDVAKEFDIPNIALWTISACTAAGSLHFSALLERGLVPLKDESYLTNGYLETPIDWIPGLKDVRLKDLPSFIRTTDPNDVALNLSIERLERVRKEAYAIIINTFDALEGEILDALKPLLPPLYAMGPLHLLHRQSSENELETIGSNLFKEETECFRWLDSKDPNSVLYVNFGSIAFMTNHQLTEFAWGLSNSKHPFIWSIRHDLVVGDSPNLPPDFITETMDRGLITGWCVRSQEFLSV